MSLFSALAQEFFRGRLLRPTLQWLRQVSVGPGNVFPEVVQIAVGRSTDLNSPVFRLRNREGGDVGLAFFCNHWWIT